LVSVEGLHPAVEKLFRERFGAPTPPQELAIPHVLSGENVLLIAPTGSGKTEAALIPILSGIVSTGRVKGIKALYITPLRALNRDMMDRISWWSAKLDIRVAVRHGDTPQRMRREIDENPPDLLITTPETLQAILVFKRASSNLSPLKWVVVDEVHELASSKRGAQLAVALERLRGMVGDFQVIGLSATVGTPEEVGKYLFSRDVVVLKWDGERVKEYGVEYFSGIGAAEKRLRRIEQILSAHKTIVFVNSRTLAEELGHDLMHLSGVAVHHGSLSRIEREDVEEGFKEGRLRGIVATSTLELGIDVGDVDYVVQYMSPRRVSDLLQRFGRSGHSLRGVSRAEVIAVSPEDALEAMACLDLAEKGYVDPPSLPQAPLDVAANQLLGIGMDGGRDGFSSKSRAEELLKRSKPFSTLSNEQLASIWDFMEKMRLIQSEGEGYKVTKRGKLTYLKNLSMINDEKLYPAVDGTSGKRIASLGMEFVVTRMYVGMDIVLKGKVWKVIRGPVRGDDKVILTPSGGQAAVPGWDGEMAPVPKEVAVRASEMRLAPDLNFSGRVGKELADAVKQENLTCSRMGMPIPSESTAVLEGYSNYLVVHYPMGDLGNRALGFYLESKLRKYLRYWWSSAYRVVLELAVDAEELIQKAHEYLMEDVGDVGAFLKAYFRERFPFAYQMKFVAERFGALEKRTPYENQVVMFPSLYAGTPIYEEALREGFETRLSVRDLEAFLDGLRGGRIELRAVVTDSPSPLASYALRPVQLAQLPSGDSAISLFKASLDSTPVALICTECGEVACECRVGEYRPMKCPKCGSPFLAPVFGSRKMEQLREALSKRAAGKGLTEEEVKVISEAKRGADLLMVYGLRGVEALSVYGVGPETAFRVLSRMLEERAFLKSLMDARLKYLETKPYW